MSVDSRISEAEWHSPSYMPHPLGGQETTDPDPVPHVDPIAGRPLDIPEEKSVRPQPAVCHRCQVSSRELHCWNCGQPQLASLIEPEVGRVTVRSDVDPQAVRARLLQLNEELRDEPSAP